jgi:hypothetical protein
MRRNGAIRKRNFRSRFGAFLSRKGEAHRFAFFLIKGVARPQDETDHA